MKKYFSILLLTLITLFSSFTWGSAEEQTWTVRVNNLIVPDTWSDLDRRYPPRRDAYGRMSEPNHYFSPGSYYAFVGRQNFPGWEIKEGVYTTTVSKGWLETLVQQRLAKKSSEGYQLRCELKVVPYTTGKSEDEQWHSYTFSLQFSNDSSEAVVGKVVDHLTYNHQTTSKTVRQ